MRGRFMKDGFGKDVAAAPGGIRQMESTGRVGESGDREGPAPGRAAALSEIPGLLELWAETLGDPHVCIAVLDGPVDCSHRALAGARLSQVKTSLFPESGGVASRHGTHVASILFGQHDGPVPGMAPRCRGLIVPVFGDGPDGSVAPCSELDLARAISLAAEEGAHVINISGGQWSASGQAHPLLADAVQRCSDAGVLIVAAAGNQGCDCLHVPGALPPVIVVGAMDSRGQPLDFSNWGEQYQGHGVLALGENILGAVPGGGTVARTGTSFATPIVSGVCGLLLSLQYRQGKRLNPTSVVEAILGSAQGCDHRPVPNCRRLLTGRLNLRGSVSFIMRGIRNMADESALLEGAGMRTGEPVEADLVGACTLPGTATIEPSGDEPAPGPNRAKFPSDSRPRPAEGTGPQLGGREPLRLWLRMQIGQAPIGVRAGNRGIRLRFGGAPRLVYHRHERDRSPQRSTETHRSEPLRASGLGKVLPRRSSD